MAAPYVARVYMNSEQKRLLVEFMERHRDFATNRMNSNYPSQLRHELWQELTNILNAEQMGVAKEVEGWKKSWKELKASVKEKVTKMKACSEKRGGKRQRAVPLTPLEERVLNLLGIPLPDELINGTDTRNEILQDVTDVLPYRIRRQDDCSDAYICSSETDVAESITPLVETQNIGDGTLHVVDDCFRRTFHKRERSPSPYVETEVSHPEVSEVNMCFETEDMEHQHREERESAFARLAAAQEELVVLKRARYQQKKEHESSMLSVFKEFVDCIKNTFPPRK